MEKDTHLTLDIETAGPIDLIYSYKSLLKTLEPVRIKLQNSIFRFLWGNTDYPVRVIPFVGGVILIVGDNTSPHIFVDDGSHRPYELIANRFDMRRKSEDIQAVVDYLAPRMDMPKGFETFFDRLKIELH